MLCIITQRLNRIQKRIDTIKSNLVEIGVMRPGSLTKQKQRRASTGKVSEYWQLSYTHRMKSRTDYVREDNLTQTRNQIKEFKRFKKLVEEWTELAIEQAKLLAKIE